MRGTKLEEPAAALDLDPGTLVLVPHINECVLCDGSPPLHIASVVIAAVDNPGAVRETASPTIMTERGARTGSLFLKKCACCGAKYNMSYAEGGSKLERGTQRIWADLTSDEDGVATRWVQCSRQNRLAGVAPPGLHGADAALAQRRAVLLQRPTSTSTRPATRAASEDADAHAPGVKHRPAARRAGDGRPRAVCLCERRGPRRLAAAPLPRPAQTLG